MKYLIYFYLIFQFSYSQVEYNHPEFNWHSFETNHFFIHFHDETEGTAREAATVAEAIYTKITDLYEFEPKDKTHLILIDPDDYSNGAAYYYDNKIMIWASPLDFELRGSHRWLQNVITHEFAHIVSLQKAMKAGTKIPGAYLQFMNYEKEKRPDVLYGYPNTMISYPIPGTVVPPWLAEGVAQFMYDDADWDHWDTHRDMILRDRTIHDNLLSFTEMNTFGKKGIGNESTYNAGFALTNYIANECGTESLKLIMDELSKPFQFSINQAIENVIGISGDELYLNFKSNLEARYHMLLSPININPVEGNIIQSDGTTNLHPKWHPSQNSFLYLSNKENDFFGQTDLFYYNLNDSTDEKLVSGVSSAPTWHPNGKIVYYSKKPKFPNRHGSKFFDIYEYNLDTEEETRITTDARAFSPVYIQRDSSIAFLTTYDGTQNISKISLKDNSIEQLTKLNDRPILSHLFYSNDSHELFFDITTHHYRDIGVYNLELDSISFANNNPHFDERNSSSNNGIRVYAQDKSGIYNLYVENEKDTVSSYVTNVTGGAFMPDISSNGRILFSLYKNGVYTISMLDTIGELPEDFVGYSSRYYEQNEFMESPIVVQDSSVAHAYVDQFPNMFIMPKIMVDYQTVKPGLYFYSNEIINRLSVFGGASLNKVNDVDLFFIFNFKRFFPSLFFETFYLTRNPKDYIINEGVYKIEDDIKFRMIQFRLGGTIPIFGTSLELSGTRQWYRAFINRKLPSEGIEAGVAYDYYRGWIFSADWKMDMVKRRLDKSINPSKGFKLWTKIDLERNDFIEGLNLSESGTLTEEFKDFNIGRFQMGGSYHYELPWKAQWTISLTGQGGFLSNDSVDSFFHFYLGGFPGLKGYPFYSIHGTKSAMIDATFRMPLFSERHIQQKWIILQNSTMGVVFQFGDAWVSDYSLKKSMGIQWRINGYSFYNFPTAIELEYHHPFDKFSRTISTGDTDQLIQYGQEGRYYAKILFDF